jgi:S-phase kinase-associated protein 1
MNVTTSDGHFTHLPQDFINESTFLMSMNDCCEPGLIPLSTIKHDTLEKLIYYNDNKDVIINETQDMLLQMVMAADFLQMDILLDRCCRTIADFLKGKSPKEIRSIFNISENELI